MKIYLVGGAVRDHLLGRASADADYLAVGANEAQLFAHIPGLTRVGRDMAVFVRQGEEYTLCTHASIEEDLQSRDLTINALAQDEAGRIIAHPNALSDLEKHILRPVAADNFLADPLRVIRAARFAATFPDFQVHDDLLAAMRAVSQTALADVAAERVGQETLKACATARPGNFLRLLNQTGHMGSWLPELHGAADIPAGPPHYHSASVLEHTAQVMDACAGDALAVWMALVHDLGKSATRPENWARHLGHEEHGETMAANLAKRLRLSNRHIQAARLAAKWHMSGGQYPQLRGATKTRLLLHLDKTALVEHFFRLVAADGGNDYLALAQTDLACVKAVKLPEKNQNMGQKSADILLQLRCEALARRQKTP